MGLEFRSMTIKLFNRLCHEQDFSFEKEKILFLHGVYDPDFVSFFSAASLDVWQPFKSYAYEWEKNKYELLLEPDFLNKEYDSVFLLPTKQTLETEILMAQAISVLKKGGMFACAAMNNAGGNRLSRMLLKMGMETQSFSKNKARCVWGFKGVERCYDVLEQAILKELNIDGHVFWSRPGIYGWNKIDKGSQILLQHLPEQIKGVGADFGCGYGFLSMYSGYKNKIYCIDAEQRALQACAKNMEGKDTEFMWADLSDPSSLSSLPLVDWIVMNPPFHEGKKSDVAVGQKFIETACKALQKRGVLYMVANSHLPYEAVLSSFFVRHEKLYEGQGYKVYKAEK